MRTCFSENSNKDDVPLPVTHVSGPSASFSSPVNWRPRHPWTLCPPADLCLIFSSNPEATYCIPHSYPPGQVNVGRVSTSSSCLQPLGPCALLPPAHCDARSKLLAKATCSWHVASHPSWASHALQGHHASIICHPKALPNGSHQQANMLLS